MFWNKTITDWKTFVAELEVADLDQLHAAIMDRLTAEADVQAAHLVLSPEEEATAKVSKIRAIQMIRERLPETRLFVAKRAVDRIPYDPPNRPEGRYA